MALQHVAFMGSPPLGTSRNGILTLTITDLRFLDAQWRTCCMAQFNVLLQPMSITSAALMTTARMMWSALQLTHKLYQLTHIAPYRTAVTACHSDDTSHVQVSILADERLMSAPGLPSQHIFVQTGPASGSQQQQPQQQ